MKIELTADELKEVLLFFTDTNIVSPQELAKEIANSPLRAYFKDRSNYYRNKDGKHTIEEIKELHKEIHGDRKDTCGY